MLARHMGQWLSSLPRDRKQRDYYMRGSLLLAASQHTSGCSSLAVLSLDAIIVKGLGIRLITAKRSNDVVTMLRSVTTSRTVTQSQSVLYVQDLTLSRAGTVQRERNDEIVFLLY